MFLLLIIITNNKLVLIIHKYTNTNDTYNKKIKMIAVATLCTALVF